TRPDFAAALGMLGAALDRLRTELAAQAERSEDLAAIARRAAEAAERLAHWRDEAADHDAEEWIRWVDIGVQGFQLHASPLSVASVFRRQIDAGARSWILTSATLSVAGDFSHYAGQLGLGDAATGSWESPFDYATQALLYVPRGLPLPNTGEHTRAVIDLALPVLKASHGRAFMLFTTLRALAAARERLADAIAREKLALALLVQGDMSKTELLARFRSTDNAVLLGSSSFWEGVDVAGDALSVVVIDKLPFAPPDDPLLSARLAKLTAAGRNAFMEWQLPQAAISLKQGAGRLIRAETDRGVLMLCDPRLVDRPWGRRIWQSLPPMRRTREVADVEAFFSDVAQPA
ncbi:MAG TPA: ATP-dependent DNA helicase, partial [Casimicrobiaceae bacterium]